MSAGRLLELTVGDLALIDRLRLTLGPGLNVITGETGAGKSLLIDALGLVRGSRADTSLVRHGAEAARVEALFDRLPEPLIAVREVATNGRSTARLDDIATTASRLADEVGPLVEIHGQHDQQRLLDERADLVRQPGGRRGQVVEPRRRPATDGHLTDGDERLREPIEQRLDPRHVGGVADERRIGPRPERQPERIDEEAFPRAGLAGDDVEAGVERQAESIDEREIDDGQLEQAPERGRIALVVRARSVVGVWCVVRVRS